MLGGRTILHFVKTPPLIVRVLFWLFMANFAVSWIADMTISRWGSRVLKPGLTSEYWNGGTLYHLHPWIAGFLKNSIWIGLGLLALNALTLPFYRDHWEWAEKARRT